MEVKRGSLIIAFLVLASTFYATLTIIPGTVEATTLFVGGIGPGNYTTIQDAINASNAGDTVFVYNGTYFENIVVNKSLSLVGEDRGIRWIGSALLPESYGERELLAGWVWVLDWSGK